MSLGVEHAPHNLGLSSAGSCLVEVERVLRLAGRRRLHCSHIRGARDVSERRGQGHKVAARVYLCCCSVAVGSGLAMECWLDGMLSVRAMLCRAWVRGDCGL